MNLSRQAHEPVLDGIRGLAIVAVILFHSSLLPIHTLGDKILHGAALAGWAGVDLFFVLSGFLITGILLRTKGEPNYYLNFYMRRILRILPLYYLFLFLAFYVVPQKVSFGFAYWTFLSNVLIGRLGHFQSAVLDITWSLALEEQFYLFWPLVICFIKRSRLTKVILIFFLVSLATRIGLFLTGAAPLKNYVLLICRMDGFCAGAWLACHLDSLSPRLLKNLFYSSATITGCIFAHDVGVDSAWMRTLGYSANALFAVSLIGCLCRGELPQLQKLVGFKFLRVCGKYSYGMYLFHMPVIHWLLSRGEGFWKRLTQAFGAGFPVQILFHIISILATLLLAALFYHAYEKHFLKLKKHFENHPKLVSAFAS